MSGLISLNPNGTLKWNFATEAMVQTSPRLIHTLLDTVVDTRRVCDYQRRSVVRLRFSERFQSLIRICAHRNLCIKPIKLLLGGIIERTNNAAHRVFAKSGRAGGVLGC